LSIGNYVVIELNAVHPATGQRLRVGYAHLQSFNTNLIPAHIQAGIVNPPISVSAGSFIGTVGGSGNMSLTTFDPHLHLQIMTHGNNIAATNYSNSVNPLLYFPQINFLGVLVNDEPVLSRTHRRNRINSTNFNFVPHPPLS
jgi:murein DD-endopeptidase MepM/ murein hydrolase activator NlpD